MSEFVINYNTKKKILYKLKLILEVTAHYILDSITFEIIFNWSATTKTNENVSSWKQVFQVAKKSWRLCFVDYKKVI